MERNIDNYYLAGFVLIIFACLIYFTSFLDIIIRPILQPFLMGSSKGKDVLYFGIFGLFLIFSRFGEKHNINWFNKSNDFYLKLSFVIMIFLGCVGILTEIYIRLSMNLPLDTTLVIVEPKMTSTSILHSHVLKSIFGAIVVMFIPNIPSGIHVGNSLAPYIPDIVKATFIFVPVLFITMIKSMENRTIFPKLLMIALFSLGIIGIMDGGLFSTPAVAGWYCMLIIMYNEYLIDHISPLLSRNTDKESLKRENNGIDSGKSLFETIKHDLSLFKAEFFSGRKVKHYFKIMLPHLILFIFLVLRFSFIFAIANTAYYEVNILEPEDSIDLNNYGVISVVHSTDRDIYRLNPDYNEMVLLNSLDRSLNQKCRAYTISWNAYSYL
jgi:hypothetical protein